MTGDKMVKWHHQLLTLTWATLGDGDGQRRLGMLQFMGSVEEPDTAWQLNNNNIG